MTDEDIENIISTIHPTTSETNQQTALQRQQSLRELATLSEEEPTRMRDAVESLRPLLQHDDTETRRYAAETVCNVTAEHPDAGNNLLAALRQCLSDEDPTVRKNAVQAVEYISREHPHDVWKAVSDIIPLYTDQNKKIQNGSDWILTNIIGSYPENVENVVADLQPFLSESETQITRKTTDILADIAAEHPAAVRSALPALRSLLSTNDTETRQHTTQVLTSLSAEHPADVQELTTDLRPLLSDSSTDVRKNCIRILSNISVAYPILEQQASRLIRSAQNARSENEYETATNRYDKAIDKLEKACVDAEPIDTADHQEIQAKIETAEKQLERTADVHTQWEAVYETLQTAEQNFQEAIVRFAAEERTVSKTRFRQARNGFDDAKQTVSESEEQLLAAPIEIRIDYQPSFPSTVLEDYHLLGETAVEELSSANITDVDDLTPDYKHILPKTVATFRTNESVSKEEITLLTVLSWWEDDSTHAFDSETAISRRYNQADYGFSETQ